MVRALRCGSLLLGLGRRVDWPRQQVPLGAGFSSNFVVFGSLAGIIVVEAAGKQGIRISFGELTRPGGWIALITMGLAAAWILGLG
jgi:Na+/H+ antiporter NhaD/arsenite permease-like protein